MSSFSTGQNNGVNLARRANIQRANSVSNTVWPVVCAPQSTAEANYEKPKTIPNLTETLSSHETNALYKSFCFNSFDIIKLYPKSFLNFSISSIQKKTISLLFIICYFLKIRHFKNYYNSMF